MIKDELAYIGTKARPPSKEPECWWFRRLSPSLDASRSIAGILTESDVECRIEIKGGRTPKVTQTM
jgi:hypothetical protein